jgi:hypothetical protein
MGQTRHCRDFFIFLISAQCMFYFYLPNDHSHVGWWPFWSLLSLFFARPLINFSKNISEKVAISARKKIFENFCPDFLAIRLFLQLSTDFVSRYKFFLPLFYLLFRFLLFSFFKFFFFFWVFSVGRPLRWLLILCGLIINYSITYERVGRGRLSCWGPKPTKKAGES